MTHYFPPNFERISCFSSGQGVAAGGTKKKRKIGGPNAETRCLCHDDVIGTTVMIVVMMVMELVENGTYGRKIYNQFT